MLIANGIAQTIVVAMIAVERGKDREQNHPFLMVLLEASCPSVSGGATPAADALHRLRRDDGFRKNAPALSFSAVR
jgi:hypothetical protein